MQRISQELIDEFLEKKNIFAVVGVSNEPEKYGHKVYFNLKKAGYSVYPINPKTNKIKDDKCYPNLSNLPILPDVVDIVVPPKITQEIVKQCKKLGIGKVWMQPGSESETSINFCIKNNIKVLYGVCVMLERSKLKR